MQTTKNQESPTTVKLTVVADQEFLDAAKAHILKDAGKNLTLTGFRKGHAPQAMVEKYVDPQELQAEFLNYAIDALYTSAAKTEQVHAAAMPSADVTKFVPYTTLEVDITVPVVGKITLPNYKKLGVTREKTTPTKDEIAAVLKDIQQQRATKQEVKRAAKEGDEVLVDFAGVFTDTKEPLAGGTAADFALVLGSNSFIPGFESSIIGMKPEQTKTFSVTFPADYHAAELQNKAVDFTVTVKTVSSVTLPKLDDAFAAATGDYKTLAELKTNIAKRMEEEKSTQVQKRFEEELLLALGTKGTVELPEAMIDDEVGRMIRQQQDQLTAQGQTWEEYLALTGETEETYTKTLRPDARRRLAIGLLLGEVTEAEKLTITNAEIQERLAALKQQYSDKASQDELNNPATVGKIAYDLLTTKTVAKLVAYATPSTAKTAK